MQKGIVGGLMAAGFALAMLISNLFTGFGGGDGSGEGDGTASTAQTENVSDTSVTEPPKTTSEQDNGPLEIVIHEYDYFLLSDFRNKTGKPLAIDEVTKLIQNSKPDDQGIKVRIHRSDASRAKAELALKDALQSAGIEEIAIDRKSELLSSQR